MTDRRPVLLTVSGSIAPPDDGSGRRPRADYAVLADAMDADIVDIDRARSVNGRIGRLVERLLGGHALLAYHCARHRARYEVVFTDGEQVGIPLALLLRVLGRRRVRHAMIVHVMSVAKKELPFRLARLRSMIDLYVVYCSAQRDLLVERLGVPPESVFLSTFMVDSDFFSPDRATSENPTGGRPIVVSAGLERRDYPTMMSAVTGLDIDVVVAAASPWSRRDDSTAGREIPENVQITRLDHHQLRDLYGRSSLVVMPLDDVDFQAGITTILEAMAMGLPVVCTRTPGQTDTIVDGVTGRYVAIASSDEMRAAIVELLDRPDERRRMGDAARAWVVANADVTDYAARLAAAVRTTT